MSRRSLSLAIHAVRNLALGLTSVFCGLLVASACASTASSVGPGGECFLASDCAPGLICIEQANKTRVCSSDLSRVAGRPPPDGPLADAGDEAGEGGNPMDGEVPPDTGTPPPDTGTPPPDTGTPPPDTGPPPDDASGE